MNQIKFGVVGCSPMAIRHMHGVDENPNAVLVSVCDTNAQRLEKCKAEFPGVQAFDCYDDLLKSGIDAVIIVTPDQLHREMVEKAVRADLHILCEKPLALTEEDCLAIVCAAEKTSKKVMVGQLARHTPSFMQAKALIDSGRIGELTFVESEYAHDYKHMFEEHPEKNYWRNDPLRNGVVGGGCHAIDLLRWIAGDVTEVCGISTGKTMPELPYDDTHVAIMKFEGGIIGKVFVSISCKRDYTMRTVLYGTKGTIITDNTSDHFTLFYTDEEGKLQNETIAVEVSNHNAIGEVAEFCDLIIKDREVSTPVTEGYKTVKAALAIVKSADMGGVPVKL